MSEEVNPAIKLPNWFLLLREIVNERHVTLGIYASIGFFTASGEVLEKDEAKVFLGEKMVFILGSVCYISGAVLLAIKMVMSGSWQKQ